MNNNITLSTTPWRRLLPLFLVAMGMWFVNAFEAGKVPAYASIISLDEDTEKLTLDGSYPVLITDENDERPPQVIAKLDTFEVRPYKETLEPGKTVYWQKIAVRGDFKRKTFGSFVLSLYNPILSHLEVHLLDEQQEVITSQYFGVKDNDYSPRERLGKQDVFFSIHNEETLYLLIKKQGENPPILMAHIYSESAFKQFDTMRLLFWGGIISLLVAFAIYNVAIYFLSKTSAYFWYLSFYALSFFYFSSVHSFGSLLWADNFQKWIGQNILPIMFTMLWIVIRFANVFLHAKEHTPKHYQIYLWLDKIILLGLFLSFLLPARSLIPYFTFLQAVGSIFAISITVNALKAGFYPARFFLVSWSFVIVGAAIGMAGYLGVIPTNFFTLHAFFFGAICELLLLSLALADRIRFAEAEATVKAYTDPRTKQPNFAFFRSEQFNLPKPILKTDGEHAILLIQIEGIRSILGILGPNRMEQVYALLVHRLNTLLQQSRQVVPFKMLSKSDNYMITLPGNHMLVLVKYDENTVDFIHEIIALSEHPLKIDAFESRIGIKVGLAKIPELDTQSITKQQLNEAMLTHVYDAYRRAQLALIEAENSQRQWCEFEIQHDNQMRQQLELLSDLKLAIQEKQFCLHIQPQFSINDKRMIGGESLVRWMHPKKGMIPPFQFIPLAEKTGNMYPITKIVIERSFQWLSEQNSLPEAFRLSINLSVHDIYREELIPYLRMKTHSYQLSPERIIFEVTESAIMEDHQTFLQVLDQLRQLGFGVALDDFGTGYSSMSYMQKMNADEIKIDMSFVRDIHLSPINQQIVSAIIQMAGSTRAFTVAEGIETEEELQILQQLGADSIQGYLTGKPVASESFVETYWSEENHVAPLSQ